MPERLARGRVQRDEVPFSIAGEHQPSGTRQRTRPTRRQMPELPLHLSARRINGAKSTPIRLGSIRRKIGAAVVSMTLFVRLRRGAENVALLASIHVKQPSLRVESWRHPIGSAQRTGTPWASFRRRRTLLIRHRTPLSVLAVAPRDLAVRLRREQLSRRAIHNVEEPAAVRLRDQVFVAQINDPG